MKKSTLLLENIRLNPYQIHKFRGFVGNLFMEHNLIHNHDESGKPIYRYPLIQFKLIDNTPAIIAVTEPAIQIFSEIFMNMNEINIEGKIIPVFEKNLTVEDVKFGYSQETYMYEFASPWIGLNQINYKKYSDSTSRDDRENILKKAMTGNILSMSKFLNHWLEKDQQIKIDLKVSEKPVNLKTKRMIGFFGIFKVNFAIPDYLGIGKSVSRGFGVARRMI